MGKTLIPEFFPISEDLRLWAETKAPTVNIDVEHETFCDYWRAHGKKMADWSATWRNWMRRAPRMGGATYSPDEVRIRVLMKEYTALGFRRAYVHETPAMYQQAFASDVVRLPVKPEARQAVLSLVGSKRL